MTLRSARNLRRVSLTKRESEICDLLVDGMTQAAAASQLGISVRTLEGHLRNIRSKTGSPTTAVALLRRARLARVRAASAERPDYLGDST